MGTRSLTRVHVEGKDSPVVVAMYRQMDGYFDGMGQDLKNFLDQYRIINGIGMGKEREDGHPKAANGMLCLAAQIVAAFKNDFGVGGIYMTVPTDEQEYVYDIYLEKGKLKLVGRCIYGGKEKSFRLKTKVDKDAC